MTLEAKEGRIFHNGYEVRYPTLVGLNDPPPTLVETIDLFYKKKEGVCES
jgi:hypothetical protein